MAANKPIRQFSNDTNNVAAILVESIRLRKISILLVEKSKLICATGPDHHHEARWRIPDIDRALKALGWLPPPEA